MEQPAPADQPRNERAVDGPRPSTGSLERKRFLFARDPPICLAPRGRGTQGGLRGEPGVRAAQLADGGSASSEVPDPLDPPVRAQRPTRHSGAVRLFFRIDRPLRTLRVARLAFFRGVDSVIGSARRAFAAGDGRAASQQTAPRRRARARRDEADPGRLRRVRAPSRPPTRPCRSSRPRVRLRPAGARLDRRPRGR